ncbi:MAG: hypothetical protein HRT44_08845 [Bdellovibrionales bacterium]|nr:hypothetical protein [Bdellovibrionales bacterium]NQZ19348.1 hypothetical protein [Bdellovibrionales bacterium]
MSPKIFRATKSEVLLSSFYFVTFFSLLFYLFILLRVSFVGLMGFWDLGTLSPVVEAFLITFKWVFLALALSAPLAFMMTIFLVLSEGRRLGESVEKWLNFLVKTPLMLVGLPVIFWLSSMDSQGLLVFVLFLIVWPRLCLRWFHVARNVDEVVVESALSLGMGFWDVLYFVYFKKCTTEFLRQLAIIFISSLGLITPFLYFVSLKENSVKLMSFHIFDDLQSSQSQPFGSALILVLLVLCLFNAAIDQKGERFGEWNG